MDAVNLAYAPASSVLVPSTIDLGAARRPGDERDQYEDGTGERRHGLFGRR
jgi:hypothetical protein